MFGQPNQQQPSGGLFGTASQLGQTSGGFTFGNSGTSSAPSVGGFNFSATSATTQQPGGFSFGSNGTKSATAPGSTGGLSFGTMPGSTGSLTQPASTGGLNLGAKPAAQAAGFSFGSVTPSSGFQFGKSAGTAASTPQTGGFAFGSVVSSGVSFGTPATQPSQAVSSGLKLGSTGSGLGFGSPAPTATPAAPGGISLAIGTSNATSSPFAGGFTLTKTSATTGTSLGGGLAQPTGLSGSMFSTPNTQTGGLGSGSAPSQGFTLGTGKTTAPATVNPAPAFTPGGATAATSSASSGFSLGSGSGGGNPTSGLNVGATLATTATSGLSLQGSGLKLGATAATPASAGFTLGIPAVTASSATPVLGSLSGLAKTSAATTTTSTTSTGLTLGTTVTTTAPGFSFPATSGIKLGTTQTTTSLSTATTTVAAGTGTIASAASAPSTSAAGATTAATSSVPQLTYKQLEEHINKWAQELADYERTFLDQAAQVNSWDRLLMENGEKITELNAGVENVKAEQKRLDQELDFIMAQQQELEEMLKPLEEAVSANTSGSSRQLQQADKERDFTYKLAKDIDGQLKQMVQDLKTIIDHLNTSNTQQQDTDDPIAQIAKILNAHMNSLQWIDQNSGILQRKVDEIARLSETRRKEQERNFRLAFD